MKVIMKRTLQETLSISSIILVVVVGALAGFFISETVSSGNGQAYEAYLNQVLLYQDLVVFFLISGVVLMAIISSVGTGLVASEVQEGTFKLLVGKPNSRRSILLGKVLGMVIGVTILGVLSLSCMFIFEAILGNFDGNILNDLMSYIPSYLLYGVIIGLFFSSLSVLLSCIMKKRIWALLPMLAIMLLGLFIPIVIRMFYYGNSIITYFDLNYHFGQIFKWCLDFSGGVNGTTSQLEIFGTLTNAFTSLSIDRDFTLSTYTYSMMSANNFIPAVYVVILYIVISIVNYFASFMIIARKDV